MTPSDFDCFRDLVDFYEQNCKPFEDYSLQYVKHLVHACETESSSAILLAKTRIRQFCARNETSTAGIEVT